MYICMYVHIIYYLIGAYTITDSQTSFTTSYTLLISGCLISFVGFLGSFGSHIEHISFLKTSLSIIATLLVFEIVCIALYYTHRDKVIDYGSWLWNFFMKKDSDFLFDMERLFHCCGYLDPKDRSVPSYCTISTMGCQQTIVDWITKWNVFITITGFVFLAMQMCYILLGVVLIMMIERQIKDEQFFESINQQPSQQHYYHQHRYPFIRHQQQATQRSSDRLMQPQYGSFSNNNINYSHHKSNSQSTYPSSSSS
ncbi:hypothetical protein BJ944DRAFT_263687 [Cunninghamella echinulata]|nr:hypothetical protein BJ944DRAFT_263687 [Cunninghamella echinulata]